MKDEPVATAVELRRRLSDRGWALARIAGISMEPTFVDGDTVRLESPESLRPGDVVTFEAHGRLYTHRLVRLAGDTVFCRGDNHVWGDPGMPRSTVVGRVTDVIGRGPLRRVHPTFSAVGLRRVLRHSLIRERHLAAELRLLAQQARGRTPLTPRGLSSSGVPRAVLDDSCLVLGPQHVGVMTIGPSGGSDRVVVPAGIYSRLPRAQREDLVRVSTAERLIVLALPREMMGWLPRQLGRLRRVATIMGLSIGCDGDAMVASGFAMPPGYVHYFGALELSAELRAALPSKRVSVKRATGSPRSLLIGSLGPRNPESGPA